MEAILPWEEFTSSVAEAEKLAQPGEFDSLALLADRYPQLRRYAAQFLDAFEFRASPASEELLTAVALLRELNASGTRKRGACGSNEAGSAMCTQPTHDGRIDGTSLGGVEVRRGSLGRW